MSGNPVPYDIQNGDLHQEYIALVHIKHPEYINWAVRISRATKRITHVSAGPILRNQEFRNEVKPTCHSRTKPHMPQKLNPPKT